MTANTGHTYIRLKHYLLTLMFLTTTLCCDFGYAAKPTGPKKKDCRLALTAVKLQDINFGIFDANTGGTVTVDTSGNRTATGGILLLGGTTAAAIFEINNSLAGCEIYPVIIKTPNNTTLTEPVGSTMTAKNFTTLPASGFTIIPGTPQLVEVGATITASAGQTGGTYNTLTTYSLTFKH